jgi:multiple sugar transport system permease protein/sn-glycerol 3-phosphate transport system permease protein
MNSKKSAIKVPSSRYKRIEKIKDFLCVAPALIVLAIFVYYPIVNLFRISFTNWNLINDQYKYVGFKNYIWLFQGSGMSEWLNSLRITFSYTLGEISITLIGGILLAALFNKMTSSFSFMRSVVFMPKYIAISTSAIVFSWILNGDYGILNYVLQLFGIGKIDWLTSQSTALISVLFLTAWRVVGYAMIIYLSAMKGISTDYYEAASLDGASGLQRFRYITLPLLSPTTLFLFVTTFIASMKVFQSIDVMTAGGPYKSTNVMVYWIYDLAFVDFRVDRAATVSCVFFVILLVFTVATMKISNKNVHYDS